MMAPHADHRDTARSILRAALDGETELRMREAQFLGGISFDPTPLTEKQAKWLAILVEKTGATG